jgi:hypothetical protein
LLAPPPPPHLKVGHCPVWRHQVFTRCICGWCKGNNGVPPSAFQKIQIFSYIA